MSQIKLNIYRRNPENRHLELDRVATAETVFIPFGVVQDILDTVDIDAVVEIMSGEQSDNDTDIVIALAPAIIGAMKEIKPILLDIFPDVTEEELRLCDTREICRVVVDILALAIKTMFKPADAKKKNKKHKKNRR